MHVFQLLHKTFKKERPAIHARRLKNLMTAATSSLKTNKLSLTALGRNLPGNIKTRSNIKKMDRLLGNTPLQGESVEFYHVMNRILIKDNSTPWLHIDWSCLCALTKMYLLRATLSMQGRSIVVYEECHPKKHENNHPTHIAFLEALKARLPASVKPVIVTDAGFRAPWFAYVRRLNWDFVGRLRHKNLICLKGNTDWVLSKASKSQRHSKSYSEPWLLVTSLAYSSKSALKTVNIYRQRMRIEESFRDLKSSYGFGLAESRSRTTGRMSILLLIAAIATFACWRAGILTRQKGKAGDFQAHSSKQTNALSLVYLGREALKKGIDLGVRQFKKLLCLLVNMNTAAQQETVANA